MKIASNFKLNRRSSPTFSNFKSQRKHFNINRAFLLAIQKVTVRDGNSLKTTIFPSKIKLLEKATREHYLCNGSFQEAIAPVLTMGQCFALMPVRGIRSKDAKTLRFSWLSYRTVYSVIVSVCILLYTILVMYWAFSQPLTFGNLVPVIFHISTIVACILFGRLAQKWPNLMINWQNVEKNLPPYTTQQSKSILAHKIKMLTIVVMTLSLIEHLLSLITDVHSANYCSRSDHPITDFFLVHLMQLFYFTKYSPVKAFFGKLLNIYATFIWNYMDLFVMLIGVGLASQFRQVNNSLIKVKGKQKPTLFWSEHREHYRKLCELCDEVDNTISKITMLSFSNNLYFVCVQLLKSLNKMPSFAHSLYFWFSLIFLIGRTLAVSLYSADINDESKRPIEVLRLVPRESWCLETKRFSEEVNSDVVALSGMKFFHLTRKLVLSVAGTIVTYELVLVQFHEDEKIVLDCT